MRFRPLHAGFAGAFLAVLLVLGTAGKSNLPPIIVDIPDDATAQNDDFGTAGLLSDIVAESSSGLGVFVDGMRIKDERINYDHAGTASGDAGVSIRDNLNSAWEISEGGTPYFAVRSANNDEKITATKRLYVTDGVASGTEKVVGGIACASATASTALLGTTETPQNFDVTCDLPANTLKVGTVMKITAFGIHTVQNSSEAHGYGVRADAVSLGDTAGSFDAGTGDRFIINETCILRSAGASGTIVCGGDAGMFAQASGTATGAKGLSTGATTTTTATIDTTQVLTIAINLDYATPTADTSSTRLDQLIVEVY